MEYPYWIAFNSGRISCFVPIWYQNSWKNCLRSFPQKRAWRRIVNSEASWPTPQSWDREFLIWFVETLHIHTHTHTLLCTYLSNMESSPPMVAEPWEQLTLVFSLPGDYLRIKSPSVPQVSQIALLTRLLSVSVLLSLSLSLLGEVIERMWPLADPQAAPE